MPERRPIVNPAAQAEHVNTDTLNVGQGPVFVEQASSLGTPSSGRGVIYAKTDGKLYFKNDAGTEFDLTATGGGGSGTNPIIREYTANDTWTKPTATNFWGIYVVCVGAGGGGGSGRLGPANIARGGAAGGSGAAFSYRLIRAAQLTDPSYTITIGAGGVGGTSITLANTLGITGGAGGSTSFAGSQTLVLARGGNGGIGGSTSGTGSVQGGTAFNSIPAYGPYSLSGGVSGAAFVAGTSAGSATDGFAGTAACPGGGGGKSITSGNVIQTTGGNGGGVNTFSTLIAGGAGSTTSGVNGQAGTNNASNNIIGDINNALSVGFGTGGGGGYAGDLTGTVAASSGGAGGNSGAGGGGGGGATNGSASGAGGVGGNGLCVIVEYYGA